MKINIKPEDYSIIKQLKQNAKASLKELSFKLNIKPSTLHKRIEKLKELGIIKNFTINVDYEKLGMNIVAFLLVNSDKALDVLKEGDFIEELHKITGENDYFIKLRVKDLKKLDEFIEILKKNYNYLFYF